MKKEERHGRMSLFQDQVSYEENEMVYSKSGACLNIIIVLIVTFVLT